MLYVLEQTSSTGDVVGIWVDWSENPDGRDEEAKLAFMRTMVIVATPVQGEQYAAFKKEVIERMKLPPYNCVDECKEKEYQEVKIPSAFHYIHKYSEFRQPSTQINFMTPFTFTHLF